MNNSGVILNTSTMEEIIEEDRLSNPTGEETSTGTGSVEDGWKEIHIQSTKKDERPIDQSYKDDLTLILTTDNFTNKFSSQLEPTEDNKSCPSYIESDDTTLDHPSDKTFNDRVIEDGPGLTLDIELNESSFEKRPDMLAKGCKLLISEVKKKKLKYANRPFNVDSTIEIRPVTGNRGKWEILLRRDTVKCYQKYGKKNERIGKKYKDYMKRVINEHEQDGSKHLNGPKENRDIPKLNICQEEIEAGQKKCGFYVCKSYCIISAGTYYAAARCNKERVVIISPHAHESNEQWVQKKETWEVVWKVINYIKTSLQLQNLPIEQIYINFGRWQSQAGNNGLQPGDCHAHINIVLTEEAIAAAKEREDDLGVLQDPIFAPLDYRYNDAIDLHYYIDYEDELEQESNSSDEFDESTPCNAHYSFSRPLSRGNGHHLLVEMHTKPSIIHQLVGPTSQKIGKVLCNVCL